MKNLYYYKNNPIVKNIFITMLASTIFMNLTTAVSTFADTAIIGFFLDDLSLSVVTYATPIFMMINTFSALFAVGGCIALSVDSGKGDKSAANKAFSLAVELLVLVGGLFVVAGLFFSNTITEWLGAEAEVFDKVQSYSSIIMISAPIFMLNIGLAFFVRNDGRPTLSMVGMIISIAVDMVLNFVFIGPMNMGVDGAAYSTVLGQLVGVFIISSHFFSPKNTLKFGFTFGKDIIRIVKNGGSTALHFVYQFLTILILNHFISRLAGTNGVVVYTVVFNLYTISLSLFEGISQTIQPMVSLYYGENSYKKIRNTLRLAIISVIVICGSVTLLLEIAPQIVPILFGINDAQLMEASSLAVRIFSVSMIIMTVNVVMGYYLQSTERNFMASFLVSMRCFVLFLASVFVLGKLFGMNGVWASYAVAEILSFVVYIIATQAERHRLKKKGVESSFLLLDKKTEDSIACATYACARDDFKAYLAQALKEIKRSSCVDSCVLRLAEEYLFELKKCDKNKKGCYIEVEIIGEEGKVIIRDNLTHRALEEAVRKITAENIQADYGPVLGWNRLCLK